MRSILILLGVIVLVAIGFYAGSAYHAAYGADTTNGTQNGIAGTTSLFSADRGPAWSYIVDLAAVIIGTLTILFAIVALALPIMGIVKFSDVLTRAESQLQTRIDPQINQAINRMSGRVSDVNTQIDQAVEEINNQVVHLKEQAGQVLETEIRPKVQEIINKELSDTIEKGKERIEEEVRQTITKIIDDSDLAQALVEKVAAELRNLQLTAQPAAESISSKEFGDE